jgi:3-phosphoshikimate 1-carboxyvinyltransferase
MLSALSYSPFGIHNLSNSDDTTVMADALTSRGNMLDIQAAGTAMRFLTAFLSKSEGEWMITGTERMKQRPIKPLVDALNALGAHIEYVEEKGFPPLRISGKKQLKGGEISMQGGVSSQYISALLMIAPLMKNGLTLHLEGEVTSSPYIRMTIGLMKQFGVDTDWKGKTISIPPQEYKPTPFTVEADWSAASYWYEIVALSKRAEIELIGLKKSSLQGDAACTKLFTQLGVGTTFTEQGVKLFYNGKRCKKLVYNFINEPDLVQTLAVTCTSLNVPFLFTGLQSLRIKETDRIEALMRELRKLGYLLTDCQKRGSVLKWNGERCYPDISPVITTYEDHRMAMAFAPIALTEWKKIIISDPGVVTKSYPYFWNDLRSAGIMIGDPTG